MNRQLHIFLVILALTIVLQAPVAAQSGGPYELTWTTTDAGGGTLTGGAYSLVSTIGQPEPGATQSGGSYSLNSGVVDAGGSGATPPRSQKVYLPLLLR